jgi:hypothetical protein
MNAMCELRSEIARLKNQVAQTLREPLTDEEIRKARHHMVDGAYQYSFMQGVRYAEAAHGIGSDTTRSATP